MEREGRLPARMVAKRLAKRYPEGRLLLLAEMEYDPSRRSNFQTFLIKSEGFSANSSADVVFIEVLSHWGGLHACIYSIGLHGVESV